MLFLSIVALFLAVYAWDAVRKVSQRREAERASRAAYFQQELDRLRNKRDAADAHKRFMESTKRLAEEAESKHLAAVAYRERYY